VLYAAAQLDAHKTVESSLYEQPDLASTISVSSSLATAASSTRSVPPEFLAAQPEAGVNATDSALLSMAEQWDAGNATEFGLGGTPHTHQSNLTPDVTASIFGDSDDWMVDVALRS